MKNNYVYFYGKRYASKKTLDELWNVAKHYKEVGDYRDDIVIRRTKHRVIFAIRFDKFDDNRGTWRGFFMAHAGGTLKRVFVGTKEAKQMEYDFPDF